MVSLIRPKRGKYIHTYTYILNQIAYFLYLRSQHFFMCPPWERGSHFTSCEPLPCSFTQQGHFCQPTPGPGLPENCAANDPLLGRFALCGINFHRWTLFFLSEMASLHCRFLFLDIFCTEIKDFRVWEYGRKKEDKWTKVVNKHSKFTWLQKLSFLGGTYETLVLHKGKQQ